MSIMESVRAFVSKCPLLKEGKLNADYLGPEPGEYAVVRVAEEEVLRRYSDGGALKRFTFTLDSRERMGQTVREHLAIETFYEEFARWLDEKSAAGELPKLDGGRSAQEIGAAAPGVMADVTGDSARYQMRCRLTYFEPAQIQNHTE